MKILLIPLMTGILLSSCTKNDENGSATQRQTPPQSMERVESRVAGRLVGRVAARVAGRVAGRVVAQHYRVLIPKQDSANSTNSINCQVDYARPELGVMNLNDQQQVSLAPESPSTVINNGVYWLRVITDENPKQPCFIKAKYLEPTSAH